MIEVLYEFTADFSEEADREISWNGWKLKLLASDAITISISWEFYKYGFASLSR